MSIGVEQLAPQRQFYWLINARTPRAGAKNQNIPPPMAGLDRKPQRLMDEPLNMKYNDRWISYLQLILYIQLLIT